MSHNRTTQNARTHAHTKNKPNYYEKLPAQKVNQIQEENTKTEVDLEEEKNLEKEIETEQTHITKKRKPNLDSESDEETDNNNTEPRKRKSKQYSESEETSPVTNVEINHIAIDTQNRTSSCRHNEYKRKNNMKYLLDKYRPYQFTRRKNKQKTPMVTRYKKINRRTDEHKGKKNINQKRSKQ